MKLRPDTLRLLLAALLLSMLAWVPAQAAEFTGRLFTDYRDRQNLDKLRLAKPKPAPKRKATKKEKIEVVVEVPEIESFKINGLVMRSSGPNAAWVDGSTVYDRGVTRQGLTVDPTEIRDGGLTVKLPHGQRSVQMAPGQAFEPKGEQVSEGFQVIETGQGAAQAGPRPSPKQ